MRLVLDPGVFKAYDVRGIHPTELDEDGAYRIGRAYVEHFEPRSIAVGRGNTTKPTSAKPLLRRAVNSPSGKPQASCTFVRR